MISGRHQDGLRLPGLTGQRPTVADSAFPSSNDLAIVLGRFVAVLLEIPPAVYIIRQPFGVFVRHPILRAVGPALFTMLLYETAQGGDGDVPGC